MYSSCVLPHGATFSNINGFYIPINGLGVRGGEGKRRMGKGWEGRVNFYINFDMSRANKEKAWDYAFGLIKVDGLKPTDDFVEMAKKEIRGELTLADFWAGLRCDQAACRGSLK